MWFCENTLNLLFKNKGLTPYVGTAKWVFGGAGYMGCYSGAQS